MEKLTRNNASIIIISAILSLGLLFSTIVAATAYNKSRPTYGSITVTGSAKKQITSDLAVWTGNFSVQNASLSEAYSTIEKHSTIVKNYLVKKGIPEDKITFTSVSIAINYAYNDKGYYQTNIIDNYRLSQGVEVKSDIDATKDDTDKIDVNKIAVLARESTELINEGVEFQSWQPQYFYTKIADLKIQMLAEATKDARSRADKIAENSGTRIIGVKSSRMGVFQITPLYSNEISDYGINDTSSIEKEIMSVMNCEFKTK